MMSLKFHQEVNYWRTNPDWYWIDENKIPHIKEDAPEEAKKSFELFMDPTPRP